MTSSKDRQLLLYSLLVVAAAVCFGTTGTAQVLGNTGASATEIGAARIVFGGAGLALIAVLAAARARSSRGNVETPAVTAKPNAVRGSLGSIVALTVVGGVGVASYQPAFFTGTEQNGVAVGTLVALGSAPILAGLLEWALTRKAPASRWWLATGIATLGVAAISGVFGGGLGSLNLMGLFGSLGAGASYAVYTLSSKALLNRGLSPALTMALTFGSAALFMIPLLFANNISWMLTPTGLITALWLGLVTTTLAYTLFARGLKHLPASRAATLTLAEPVTAALLGVLVLGEQVTLHGVLGAALLLGGLAVLAVPANAVAYKTSRDRVSA